MHLEKFSTDWMAWKQKSNNRLSIVMIVCSMISKRISNINMMIQPVGTWTNLSRIKWLSATPKKINKIKRFSIFLTLVYPYSSQIINFQQISVKIFSKILKNNSNNFKKVYLMTLKTFSSHQLSAQVKTLWSITNW